MDIAEPPSLKPFATDALVVTFALAVHKVFWPRPPSKAIFCTNGDAVLTIVLSTLVKVPPVPAPLPVVFVPSIWRIWNVVPVGVVPTSQTPLALVLVK